MQMSLHVNNKSERKTILLSLKKAHIQIDKNKNARPNINSNHFLLTLFTFFFCSCSARQSNMFVLFLGIFCTHFYLFTIIAYNFILWFYDFMILWALWESMFYRQVKIEINYIVKGRRKMVEKFGSVSHLAK